MGPPQHPIPELDDAVAEPVLVDELEVGARIARQCGVAAAEDDRPDEQLEIVDQAGHERLCREVRTTHGRSRLAAAFRSCTPCVSKWRSLRVFSVEVAARLEAHR
jgi:hypothetical protein